MPGFWNWFVARLLAKRFTIEVFRVRVTEPPLPQSSSRRVMFMAPPLNWVAPEPVEGTMPVRMAALTVVELALALPESVKFLALCESTQFGDRTVRASDASEAG